MNQYDCYVGIIKSIIKCDKKSGIQYNNSNFFK